MANWKKIIDISSAQSIDVLDHIDTNDVWGVIIKIGGAWVKYPDQYYKDSKFNAFYDAAKAKGLAVGGYWFSCANSHHTIFDEMNFLFPAPGEGTSPIAGRMAFDLPIYIDYEAVTMDGVRYDYWESRDQLTEVFNEFKNALDYFSNTHVTGDKPLRAGYYTNPDYYLHRFNPEQITGMSKWIACWSSTAPLWLCDDIDIWQWGTYALNNGKGVDGDYLINDKIMDVYSKEPIYTHWYDFPDELAEYREYAVYYIEHGVFLPIDDQTQLPLLDRTFKLSVSKIDMALLTQRIMEERAMQ